MVRVFLSVFLAAFLICGGNTDATAALASPNAPSNAEIEQSLQALKLRSPGRHKRILELRETDPNAFAAQVLQVAREEKRLATVKREIPENYQLQIAMWNNREKLRHLIDEFRAETDSAGRQIIESQVDNLLGEQFELRRQMRMNRVKVVERRLAQVRDGLKRDPVRERDRFIAAWKPKLLAKPAKKAE